jgi:hypothetical protein
MLSQRLVVSLDLIRVNAPTKKSILVTDETTQALRAIFDDDLLLAVLDLVDNKCGRFHFVY